MKCVIPCAGRGVRMGVGVPKALTKVNGRALLDRVIRGWLGVVDSYVIIASPQNERQIRGALKGVNGVEFVTQPAPAGLADAILQAELFVNGRFIVNLSDCLFEGEFEEGYLSLGVGVWESYDLDEINKSYLVNISPLNGLVKEVIEKPDTTVPHGNCGMGVYFLDERVFDYVRAYRVWPGGGDFTAVLQSMIDAGEEIKPVRFVGKYININSPDDLVEAGKMFK